MVILQCFHISAIQNVLKIVLKRGLLICAVSELGELTFPNCDPFHLTSNNHSTLFVKLKLLTRVVMLCSYLSTLI